MDTKHNYKKSRLQDEFRILDFEDVDDIFYEDDQSPTGSTLRLPNEKTYSHICPRCRVVSRISGHYPYCPECNWDYLADAAKERISCAA